MIQAKVQNCIEAMLSYIESADYAGYDPYDALNSPLIRRIGKNNKWVRIGAMQLNRLSPVNLRLLFGIRKGQNPKGVGLFLWGYSKLYALTKERRYLDRVGYILNILEHLQSRGYSGHCWGHNFDWQNRVMYVPKYTPTIVNSAFIGHALLDAYSLCRVSRALDMAIPIKDFILRDLNRRYEDDGLCFSYTPLDNNFVHNANLLGASLLIRLHRLCGNRLLEEAGLASLAYSLSHQRDDGAWSYAQTDLQGWVDSFHTGFNLQALQYFIAEGYGFYCQKQYESGLEYYTGHFFLADGTPKYYDNRVFPIDIHSPCQAIVVLSDDLAGHHGLVDRILQWMLQHMFDPKGYFYFRKSRFLMNKIPYMRWSQAWAFHALTSYSYNLAKQPRTVSPHLL